MIYTMKKFIYTLLPVIAFLILAAVDVSAQEASITGIVADNDGEPVPNATVAILNPETGELTGGTSSGVDGTFKLTTEPGEYTLRVCYVSYQTVTQTLSLAADETYDAGTVTLVPEEATLDELVVEGERSYMEMNFDSRRFNVGKDITSLGGSALDVLDNVPSITTDFEGNVSLRGNQGVQILINGRPSSLVRNGTDALSSIPASLIQSVEIITNPSARYEAQGTGGIINIKLVDNADLGFNGSIQSNAGYPQDYGTGVNLNYNDGNINWFLNLDLEYESEPESGFSFQSFSADTTYLFSEENDVSEKEREGNIF